MIPRLRSPIVLVHGLFGFSRLILAGRIVSSYFPGIPSLFQSAGNRVLEAQLSPIGGVAERAAQLREFLNRESPQEPVHILAHSMGGLDARYLISRLEMADRVLSLTTIGTPHSGSPFVDWAIQRLERLVKPLLELLDIGYQAFYDLTTARCTDFNREVPDAPDVRYFSVAGQFDPDWSSPEWRLSHGIVARAEGPNDGVVSVRSATFGESCDVWHGDHVSLINWPNPVAQARGHRRDRSAEYAGLIRRLAEAGF